MENYGQPAILQGLIDKLKKDKCKDGAKMYTRIIIYYKGDGQDGLPMFLYLYWINNTNIL